MSPSLGAALALALASAPATLAEQVRAQLADGPKVRGDFVQKKTVKGFKRPLTSRGDFVVVKGQGVRWHTREPFDAVLTVRPNDITSRQGGVEVFHLDAEKEPTVKVVNSVLFALLAGDLGVLERHFEVKGAAGPTGWTLELEPRDAGLGRVLRHLALQGDRFVRHLTLFEASGDVTELTLEGARLDPGTDADAGAEPGW
jgi:Outer membrane lipoprotein carrier protein LolA-like